VGGRAIAAVIAEPVAGPLTALSTYAWSSYATAAAVAFAVAQRTTVANGVGVVVAYTRAGVTAAAAAAAVAARGTSDCRNDELYATAVVEGAGFTVVRSSRVGAAGGMAVGERTGAILRSGGGTEYEYRI
jgi:hypothetical protein